MKIVKKGIKCKQANVLRSYYDEENSRRHLMSVASAPLSSDAIDWYGFADLDIITYSKKKSAQRPTGVPMRIAVVGAKKSDKPPIATATRTAKSARGEYARACDCTEKSECAPVAKRYIASEPQKSIFRLQ